MVLGVARTDETGVIMLDTLRQDVNYAVRTLRRSPGFTLTAIVTLALGMGANATIFTLLDAVLLKPLRVSHPEELFTVYENSPDAPSDAQPDAAGGTGRYLRFSYPRFQLLQQALGGNGSLAASTLSARFVGRRQGVPQAAAINTQLVSGLYFSTLGVTMQRGRPLTENDMRDERALVGVISDRYWKTAFGGSEQTVGQTIQIKDTTLTIVGVAAPDFVGIRTDAVADLWVPFTLQAPLGYAYNSSAYGGADRLQPWAGQDNISWLNVFGRVDRSKRAQAIAVLKSANAQGLRRMADTLTDPRERQSTMRRALAVSSLAQGFSGLRNTFSAALLALAAMVAVVLLVTCANISNLLLARAAGRGRETGIRISLGASTARLVRQHLIESLLLSVAGGVTSVLASYWTSAFLAHAVFTRSGDLPPVFALDMRVWLFAAAMSVGCAIAFGLIPALRSVTMGYRTGVTINQRVSTATATTGMRPLVVGQLALSFGVVFAAILLGRTLSYFAHIDPGFNPDRLITAAIDPDTSGFTREQIPGLVDRLLAEVDAIPGVTSTSVTTCALMSNCSYSSGFIFEGAERGGVQLHNNWVSPAYFSTVGISLISGRDFTAYDAAQSPRVAIVSESIARRYFPNGNPIGRRLGYSRPDFEIVGVVRDVRSTMHAAPEPMIYFPTKQPPNFRASPHAIVVRVAGDADVALPSIRAAIQRAAPGLLIDSVTTMTTAIERDVTRERLIAYLAGSFAVLALLLASIGLYGVLSYTVARRTREMGVRMALGALPRDVTRMVIGDGARVAFAGVTLGILAAVAAGRLVTTLLAGVTTSDPATFMAVALCLTAVALTASYLPARRASRIDPATALRTE
jgi:predicted permease